jgi:hypothetical protein
MDERAPQFRAVPVLLQELYGRQRDSDGAYHGFYAFDSLQSLDTYRRGDLAASIPATYEAEATIELYDLLFALHPDVRLHADTPTNTTS